MEKRRRTSVSHEEVARLDARAGSEHAVALEPLDESPRPLLTREPDPELPGLVAAKGQDALDALVVAVGDELVPGAGCEGRGDQSNRGGGVEFTAD